MTRIRALVVEDSPTVRDQLCTVLAADPGIEVVGEAGDGRRAIELCLSLRPDVITMDMMLPVMTGLAATEYIMAHAPTPILIVSSSFNRGEVFKTYDALAAGAVDVLEKPNGQEAPGAWEERFLSTVKLVSRIRVITHPRARLNAQPKRDVAALPQASATHPVSLVAIGASTGGPSAVVDIIRELPSDFHLPILLVMHLSPQFGHAYADWLDGQSSRRAMFAREGEPVAAAAGRIVMAPPERHLIVERGRLHLHDGPERFSCRPSVDVLFESVAREYGAGAAGCLLTGMGRDGAAGLLAMYRAGAVTIAQDEATSVVYGMPREAAILGAAGRILPLGEIGPALSALARLSGEAKR